MASRRFPRGTLPVLALLSTLFAGGCASAPRSLAGVDGVPAPASVTTEQYAYIDFENASSEQAAIYVVSASGAADRVATVMSGRREKLRLGPSVLNRAGPLRFVARLLARRHIAESGPVEIHAGDRMSMTLQPNARILSVLPGPAGH